MSASKSMIKLPMPTSHSESSYSKLVGSPDLPPVVPAGGGMLGLAVIPEDTGDTTTLLLLLLIILLLLLIEATAALGASAQPRESGRASSSPAAASGPDSFIGPATRRQRWRCCGRRRLWAREPHRRRPAHQPSGRRAKNVTTRTHLFTFGWFN